MSEQTNIEWCDSTFNPWIGCTKVSPACDHCYAEALMDHRMHKTKWGAGNVRERTSASNWRQPIKWNNRQFFECTACGWRGETLQELSGACVACNAPHIQIRETRRRVFCASLADVFDNEVDPLWRLDLLDLIESTPNLDWLLLTKRIGNVSAMIAARWNHKLPDNVWLGATICNQDEANRDIPKLLAVLARVRFLSIEPLIGSISLRWMISPRRDQSTNEYDGLRALDWVIVGGESGPHARPMHPEWVHGIRNQCIVAGVPFLFKQWGEYVPNYRTVHELKSSSNKPKTVPYSATSLYPAAIMDRVGKKMAGRLLEGYEWNQFPEVRP